jgi:membrane-associated phospholipid phosphatase
MPSGKDGIHQVVQPRWARAVSIVVPVLTFSVPLLNFIYRLLDNHYNENDSVITTSTDILDGWWQWLVVFVGAIVTDFSTKLLKLFTSGLFPYVQIFRRPQGAANCDAFVSNGLVEGKPGFPSGHSAQAGFLAVVLFMAKPFLDLYLEKGNTRNHMEKNTEDYGKETERHRNYEKWRSILKIFIGTFIGVILILATTMARIYMNCHNVLQVVVGSIIGVFVGVCVVIVNSTVYFSTQSTE